MGMGRWLEDLGECHFLQIKEDVRKIRCWSDFSIRNIELFKLRLENNIFFQNVIVWYLCQATPHGCRRGKWAKNA